MMEVLGSSSLAASGSQQTKETAIPELIGDYRILLKVGRGGVGGSYEAQQASVGRRRA
jgi:hypothetical protein